MSGHLYRYAVLNALYIILDFPSPSGLQWFRHWRALQLPPVAYSAVIPVILLAKQLLNTSSTLSISPITAQLLLPYNITNCTTTLYIIYLVHTVSLVSDTTFPTIAHGLHVFRRFWYRAAQLILLYVSRLSVYCFMETVTPNTSSYICHHTCEHLESYFSWYSLPRQIFLCTTFHWWLGS